MRAILITLFLIFFQLYCPGQADTLLYKNRNLSTWAYEAMNIPKLNVKSSKEILVAVIDDGFRLSHKSLKDFFCLHKQGRNSG